MKSVLGRIITLVFMVLGELALGVLLFNYLTSKFVFIEVFFTYTCGNCGLKYY